MSTEDLVFTGIILFFALFYIYKTLFKKSDCGSCACAGNKENKKSKKTKIFNKN
ncbi:MAG: hypothetical protein MJK08_03290 [Campylobacterales bacterium]|nr:hypothetical protein [Campylobacterales bacterium]NQY53264.1 hypothetical protein [Campylobacteraceae bacterium]